MLRKTVEGYLYEEFIYCHCQCGFTRSKYDINGREYRFIKGHENRGRKYSEEQKKKMCGKCMGENNGNWRGDKVGYLGIHAYVRRHFPKPKDGLCQMCRQVPFREAANITGILNREFKNWAWFCALCHHEWDNIYERGKITKKLKKEKVIM